MSARAQEPALAGARSLPEAGAPSVARAGNPVHQALAVWRKDLVAEWRSRYAVGSSLLFAVATLAVLSFAVGPVAARSEIAAGLLWVLLLFAATASLGQGFQREMEGGTWDLLRQRAGPGPVLIGKWGAALTVLAGIEVVVLATAAILLPPRIENPAAFAAVLVAASLPLGLALPLVAALLAHARRHGGLAAALSFPLLVPTLLAGVSGTRRAFEGEWPGGELRVLAAFTGVVGLVGWLLFTFLWDE